MTKNFKIAVAILLFFSSCASSCCCLENEVIPEADWHTMQGIAIAETVGHSSIAHQSVIENAIEEYIQFWLELLVLDGTQCEPEFSRSTIEWVDYKINGLDGMTYDLCGPVLTRILVDPHTEWSPDSTILKHEVGHIVLELCDKNWSHENMERLQALKPSGPIIRIATQGFSDVEIQEIDRGSRVWQQMGVTVLDINSSSNVDILITIIKDHQLNDKAGLSGGGKIRLSWKLTEREIPIITAHELGHELGINGHLPDGKGLMSSPPATGLTLTEADHKNACDIANLCQICDTANLCRRLQ